LLGLQLPTKYRALPDFFVMCKKSHNFGKLRLLFVEYEWIRLKAFPLGF
jgi:hypothetical protein